jgi:nucleoside-diphosphate-sugar epimerase
MKTLVVGATGATGKHLVNQLLEMGQEVKVIVRASSNIPEHWNNNEQLSIIRGNIHEISVDEMADHLRDCQAAASCLGHNLSMKGIYGKPQKLVKDAVKLICDAIPKNAPADPFKFALMNTAGNQNRDLNENISFGEKIVLGLIRLLLPPHPDNEKAADYLRVNIGQNHSSIRWVVVRPDSLINEDEVTAYTVHPSPTRSALFNPGKTSRINVGHFMATLITNNEMSTKWEGQMPVIYNEVDE